ncbi:hypothetical protein CHH55_23245 [Niallia circulans]|uniref:hypothetical protein n=1 Tax=Niallia circulans TaxID=1397 RepID=UPI000BA740AE|nr:hypothetical protein [Niallia circulans]PAD85453.1 hypothetical protein CHH55_23245 [Niallia circulans]
MTSSLSTIQQHIVKGIHYLDLIAYLKNQGASISDLKFENDNTNKHISFSASFCDNMTILKEDLYYQNDLLIEWTVTSSDGPSRVLFSREKLNNLNK